MKLTIFFLEAWLVATSLLWLVGQWVVQHDTESVRFTAVVFGVAVAIFTALLRAVAK